MLQKKELARYCKLIGRYAGSRPTVRETGGSWIAGPQVLALLLGNARWKVQQDHFDKSMVNLNLVYDREDFALIPTELQLIVDAKVRLAQAIVVDIAKRAGFDSDQFFQCALTEVLLIQVEDEFNRGLYRADRERMWHAGNDWREQLMIEVARTVFEQPVAGPDCSKCNQYMCPDHPNYEPGPDGCEFRQGWRM